MFCGIACEKAEEFLCFMGGFHDKDTRIVLGVGSQRQRI